MDFHGKKRKTESDSGLNTGTKNNVTEGGPPKKKKRHKKQWTGISDISGPDKGTDILSEAPREIKIVEFAQSRAAEIEALSKLMTKAQGTRQLSQLLPKHMRRRACSHNIKRLPRRVHMVSQKEYENQEGKPKSKPPSRKHQRRPKNLLEEYNRRQRKHVWLETHIWHAKRFKMTNKWGYRIPVQPTDKSARAAYRATQHHCQIQDISYLCCIDIKGSEERIIDGLKHLCSPLTGLTFAAKSYLSGVKEGQTVLYAFDKYPYGAIGCVTFLWKPLLDESSTAQNRELWIWCHPSCYEEVWSELEKCFSCSENDKPVDVAKVTDDKGDNSTDENRVGVDKEKGDNFTEQGVDVDKAKGDNIEYDKKDNIDTVKVKTCTEEKGANASQNKKIQNRTLQIGNISMESLKDNLVRFRLTGPSSHVVLSDLLKPATIVPADDSSQLWWQKYFKNKHMSLGFNQQRELWESVTKCQSVAELPPHCIMGLTVRDPRVLLPPKRVKILTDNEDIDTDVSITMETLTPDISYSPLWHCDVREEVKKTKMSESQLNQLKSDQFIPGSSLHLGQDESRIPVVLIQRPGVQQPSLGSKSSCSSINANYGAGLDIILPSSWSMAFWVGLIYRGARAGGLRESKCLVKEQGMLYFPEDYPDTVSGKREEQDIYEELVSKYERRPPAKRANYTKLGIKSPFYCPWEQLVKEWAEINDSLLDSKTSSDDCKMCVLRDINGLRQLDKLCSKDITCTRIQKMKFGTDKLIVPKLDLHDFETSVLSGKEHSLTAVRVTMVTRGAPEEFSVICIPSADDLTSLLTDRNYGGPVEPVHPDMNKCKKKDKKKDKKFSAKSKLVLGHKETSDSNTGKINMSTSCDSKKDGTKVDNVEPKSTEHELPLLDNVVNSCSRQIMGFLKHGGFSLGRGMGTGVGFCSTVSLIKLLTVTPKQLPCIVLIRNPMSRQYRFAFLSILIDNISLL